MSLEEISRSFLAFSISLAILINSFFVESSLFLSCLFFFNDFNLALSISFLAIFFLIASGIILFVFTFVINSLTAPSVNSLYETSGSLINSRTASPTKISLLVSLYSFSS